MKKSESGKIGVYGEQYVAEYLLKSGYELIGKNYHSRYGEIDLIVQKDGVLCFVEVKTRTDGCMFDPVYSVNISKRKKIIKTAYQYIAERQYDGLVRFDVALLMLGEKNTDLTYIEDAFEAVL